MTQMLKNTLYVTIILSVVVFCGCRKKGCTDANAINFNQKAKKDDGSCLYDEGILIDVLTDVGNDIILPRYYMMDSLVQSFNESIILFANNLTLVNLIEIQQKLKLTELAWQKCATFEFGPAGNNNLRAFVNTFPTDTAAIENAIQTQSYDLSSFLAIDHQGLPALDYLLHHQSNDSLISLFQNSSSRLNFLKDVSDQLNNRINTVYNLWLSTDGNYINTFVNSKGTDVSSSLSYLVNQFNNEYELVKNAKIGIPLGKSTLGAILPTQVEAYYEGISSELALAALIGLHDLYMGISESGEDKKGLHDYLVDLKNEELPQEISTQFNEILNAVEAIPDPLSETINNNPSIVDVAYEEIKKLVILIKTDMSTEMEVAITYSDGDGD